MLTINTEPMNRYSCLKYFVILKCSDGSLVITPHKKVNVDIGKPFVFISNLRVMCIFKVSRQDLLHLC